MAHYAPMPEVRPMMDVHLEAVINHAEADEWYGDEPNSPGYDNEQAINQTLHDNNE